MSPPRVLVTGAGGFIGRALVDRLVRDARFGAASLCLVDVNFVTPAGAARRIDGDLADSAVLAEAVASPPDIVIHLASLPGGAAEADPRASRRVNLDASLDLFEALAAQPAPPRLVCASSIAVFGELLPASVDDETPPRPSMTYGAHKQMVEIAIADWKRRGGLNAIALRLPGIMARSRAAGGFKSSFMSDVFHALLARESFEMPVGPDATAWLMSVRRCVDNLIHAIDAPPDTPPVLTLPAVRVTMAELVDAISQQVEDPVARVTYEPDAALEAQFGRQPQLDAAAAVRAGFRSDGDAGALVSRVLEDLAS